MSQPLRIIAEADQSVSTILSERVLIPVSCDHCKQDTDISLETLKTSSAIMCEHCYAVRPFGHTELQVIRSLLNRSGYRVNG
ncbi:MAG: hypothetical protein P1U57_06920 [Oleibacter sp.]|nr:hypothetical protein [Thalassolituus sp.]